MKFNFENLKKEQTQVLQDLTRQQEQAYKESLDTEPEQKEAEIDTAWKGKADYEERQAKREQKDEEMVANRNRRQFAGRDPEELPYLETGEHREVLYTTENIKFFDRESLELIQEDISKDGTDTEKLQIVKLIERHKILDELEQEAKANFRHMLSFEKNTGERVAAYELWKDSKKKVMDFESASLANIFNPSEPENIPVVELQEQEEDDGTVEVAA